MIDKYIADYGKRLYGLCSYLCGNADAADDLYQETWLKVCGKINRYDNSKPFEAWLTKICVNTYRDLLRKNKRSPFAENFSTNEEKDSIIENIQSKETKSFYELHCAIENLPEKLRITIIFHYFHDLDEKKTAQTLGIPLGTVKSRLNKAKKLLREELENERRTF